MNFVNLKNSKFRKWIQTFCILHFPRKSPLNVIKKTKRRAGKTETERLQQQSHTDASGNYYDEFVVQNKKKHDEVDPGFFEKESRCSKTLRLCSITYCCYDISNKKLKFGRKGPNEQLTEQDGD